MTTRVRNRLNGNDDAGFTLIELLVAIVLFAMVGTVLMATVGSTSNAATVAKSTNGINEEARLTLNRIARELREARNVTAVSFTGGVATSLTFDVDFNGNGAIDSSATDPETLTYCYDTPNKRILLTPHLPSSTDCADPDSLPVLTTDVEAFTLDFRSSLYQYDSNADGVTTWQELDNAVLTAGVGNRNGVLDAVELRNVDSVVVSITVFKGPRRQTYRTQVNLRNRP